MYNNIRLKMLKEEYKNFFENQNTHWWYLGMREINTSLLKKYLPKKKNLRILDAGCGTGAALLYLKNFGKTIGIDISPEALKYARKIGRVKKGDISALPFKNESFDLVVCLDVIYHLWVRDYQKVLKEFNRVLKKDGLLLLREPAFQWLKSSHDIIEFTGRRFTKNELKKALENTSFAVLKLSYINFFLFPLVVLKRMPEVLGFQKPKPKSDVKKIPKILNLILFSFLKLEVFLLKYFSFPWGSSVVSIARKLS